MAALRSTATNTNAPRDQKSNVSNTAGGRREEHQVETLLKKEISFDSGGHGSNPWQVKDAPYSKHAANRGKAAQFGLISGLSLRRLT